MLLRPESGDVIERLHSQIAHVFAGRAGDAKIREIFNSLLHFQHNGDSAAQYVLLPLCFTLLILHENYRVQESGGAFRYQYVGARLIAVLGALAAYSQICGLIIHIFGGGKDWMSTNNLLDSLTGVEGSLVIAWKNNSTGLFGMGDIWKLLPHLLCIGCLLLSCLFAYVVGLLLSLVQHAFLMILLGLGKMCIVLTLVPGVGLASSWARSLAQLSAWSLVGKVITNLLVYRSIGQLDQAVATGHWIPLLKLSAEFLILGLSMALVPMFVHKVAAGVAPGGFISSIAKTMFAAKLLTMGRGVMPSRVPVTAGGPGGGSRRPHKMDRSATRSVPAGATFVGANAAASGIGSIVRAMRLRKDPAGAKAQEPTPLVDRPPASPEPNTIPEREEKLDALRARSKEAVEPMGGAQKAAAVAVPTVVSGGKATPMRVAAASGTPAPKTAVASAAHAGTPAAPAKSASAAASAPAGAPVAPISAATARPTAAPARPSSPLQVAGAQAPRQPRIFIQETPRGGMRASRLPPMPQHDTNPDGGPPALRRETRAAGKIDS